MSTAVSRLVEGYCLRTKRTKYLRLSDVSNCDRAERMGKRWSVWMGKQRYLVIPPSYMAEKFMTFKEVEIGQSFSMFGKDSRTWNKESDRCDLNKETPAMGTGQCNQVTEEFLDNLIVRAI